MNEGSPCDESSPLGSFRSLLAFQITILLCFYCQSVFQWGKAFLLIDDRFQYLRSMRNAHKAVTGHLQIISKPRNTHHTSTNRWTLMNSMHNS